MTSCQICSRTVPAVAKSLGVCTECIKLRFDEAERFIRKAHEQARVRFHLPSEPPKAPRGQQCRVCFQQCVPQKGAPGYCGLPVGDRSHARVSWYYDPLPTNCVADFVCPGGTGCGFPKFAYREGPETGFDNLAVFYEACSFDCLFCQNWTYRESFPQRQPSPPDKVTDAVRPTTACICFFGGDPTPQLPHALEVARLARERRGNQILRICWETNGSMSETLLDEMVAVALDSGGCIKFDLKAWNEQLHIALTGVSNRRTLDNFRRVARRAGERPKVPLLVAATLLVPGYVDEEEVGALARFIASLDRSIPYSLLAFHPDFMMSDLPPTSLEHAKRALRTAREAGLTRIHLGNRHLLWSGGY